jgi:hypothetical protein
VTHTTGTIIQKIRIHHFNLYYLSYDFKLVEDLYYFSVHTKNILYGTQKGLIRKLSLFNPSSHHVPKQYNAITNHFVEKIGAEALSSKATDLLDQLRLAYQLKRKAFSYNETIGSISVETPQLDYQVSITQNQNQPKEYVLTTQINSLKDSALINDPHLTQIFDPHCDQLQIELGKAINIEDCIDTIETIQGLECILEYPANAAYCRLSFKRINLNIEIKPNDLHFQAILPKGLNDFLKNTNEALNALNQVGLNLSLFQANEYE